MIDFFFSSWEDVFEVFNCFGIDGIEFIEYMISQFQVLGQVLEGLGFCFVVWYCLCEVMLYWQGDMNLVVNVGVVDVLVYVVFDGQFVILVVVLCVQDVLQVYMCCIELGVWVVFSQVQVMELYILVIYGLGGSCFYFVD